MRRHQNVFANHITIVRPKVGKTWPPFIPRPIRPARAANVVGQSVKPDVTHKIRVKRQLNAPPQPRLGPGNTQVRPLRFIHRLHQIAQPTLRKNRLRMSLQKRPQPRQMLLQPKIPVLLLQFHHLPPLRSKCAVLPPLLSRDILLLPHTVKPTVRTLGDFSRIIQFLQQGAHHLLVALIRRLNPSIMTQPQRFPETNK